MWAVTKRGRVLDEANRMSSIPEIKLPAGFEALNTEEKLRYLHRLWELVADDAEEIPVPSSHLQIVEQRRAAVDDDSGRRRTYDDLRTALENRKK